MPMILSFNMNINDFKNLLSFKDFINRIFKEKILVNKLNYKLISFITQPKPNHFVAYFQNQYLRYTSSLLKWFRFDDMVGVYKEIKNVELSLSNIRQSEAITLLIYLKDI